MATKGIFSILVQQHKARVKPALLYFFAGLLLFLFSGQKLVAFGENSVTETFPQKDISVAYSIPTCRFSKLHLPFESAPTSNDREIPDENEQEEDDSDYDWNFMAEQQAQFSIFDFLNAGKCFAPSSTSIYNHSSVPFFILYHSWKSFMS